MKQTMIISLVSLFLLCTSSISAKKTKRKTIRLGGRQGAFFKKYDLNKDGKISQSEYMSLFRKIDLDKDKNLDLYELSQYQKKMQAELKNR
ncbi:MAG: hypothetical protein AAF518_14095 [Spirochaetota bacterium]